MLVRVLHEESARDLSHFPRFGSIPIGQLQQAQVLLCHQHLECIWLETGRNDDLGENFGDGLSCGLCDDTVRRDHTAERRHGVAGVCTRVGGCDVVRRRDSAGVGVLDDGDRRTVVVEGRAKRRVGVDVVVVRHLFAVKLCCLCDARTEHRAVQRGGLMRVFAVAKSVELVSRDAQCRCETRLVVRIFGLHPRRNCRVVPCGVRERLPSKDAALAQCRSPVGHGGNYLPVVGRVNNDCDVVVVLRRCANHCGTADIDIFNDGRRRSTTCDGRGERIQIHDDEVERFNSQFGQLVDVRVVPQVGEDSAVDRGVQRLDATIERFRETGYLGHLLHVEPRVANRLTGRARRHHRNARFGEC